jgi:hypothetical protein
LNTSPRRFLPPWQVEQIPGGYKVLDASGQALAYVYARDTQQQAGHCQSKFVYFAKTSEPDFAVIDFPAFFRVDLSGSMAAPSI